MIAPQAYQLWLQGRYSYLPETSGFRKHVNTYFEEEVKPLFGEAANENEQQAYFQALANDYRDRAARKASFETQQRKNSIGIAGLIFVGIFGYVAFVQNEASTFSILFFVGMMVFLLGAMWLVNARKKQQLDLAEEEGFGLIRMARDSGLYKEIPPGQFPEVIATIRQLGQQQGIDLNSARFFFDPRKGTSPSVSSIEEKGQPSIFITFTRSSLTLHQSNLGHFNALYAHELGHLLQEDTKLWIEKLVPAAVFHPLLRQHEAPEANADEDSNFGLELEGFDIDLDAVVDAIDVPAVGLLFGPYIRKVQVKANRNVLRGLRYESEYLSDYASVAMTKGLEILSLIEKDFFQSESSDLHPKSDWRILSLKYRLSQTLINLRE
ncbi:MAG: hypothetical protein ACFB10_18055 [Salibacteraceae bacterium]